MYFLGPASRNNLLVMGTSVDIEADVDVTENTIISSNMNTADWRWAAVKGFWDPLRRCWNEEVGGMNAYLSQRNQRRASRETRQQHGICVPKTDKNNSQESCIRPSKISAIGKRQATGPSSGAGKRRHKDQTKTCVPFCHDFRSQYLPSITESQTSANGDINQPTPTTSCPYAPGLLARSLGTVWPQPVCRRYWSLGYQAEPIIEIFHQLPTALRDAIGEALDEIQYYADTLRRHAPRTDPAVEAECGHLAGAWERDDVHAFVRVDFAPDTHERVAVDANARMAELLGMRHEELLARFARNDVPLALPPLDVLCCFLHSLRAAYDAVSTRYARILVPGGAALVRVSTAKAFDPLRQLCQVPPVPLRPAPCPPNPAL
jgi:hypothetical protein